MRSILGLLFFVGLAACGGSDSSSTCGPSGSWATGSIDLGTCQGTVTTTSDTPTADPSVTITTTAVRNVQFSGNSVTGALVANVTASATVTGLPCSANYTTSGSRQ